MKSFLKWVGGKTDIKDTIISHFPKVIGDYYEPFIGGGAILIRLLEALEAGEIHVTGKLHVSDINENLINLYLSIKNSIEELLVSLEYYKDMYITAPNVEYPTRHKFEIKSLDEAGVQEKGKAFVYYWMRMLYNTSSSLSVIDKSALFLVLNKTCFRGLHRVGKNGFNVPFGNYSSPSIFEANALLQFHELFQKYDITFTAASFQGLPCKVGDFVYLDPPYCPIEKNSFVSYNESGFAEREQTQLYELCCHMKEQNIKFIQSNSKSDFVTEMYGDFKIIDIEVKRRINSKIPQSTAKEVLILNLI